MCELESDEVLAQRLQSRDPQALAALYDRYGRIAYAIVFRTVQDAAAAEDLVQETFLRVWNRAGSFDGRRGALGKWILAVARNRAIDYLRSVNGRMAAGEVSLENVEGSAAFCSATDQAASIDRKRRLEGAFQKLTPNQRKVVHLTYYEGLSHSELALRLKQPLGTVKTWAASALRVLRAELA